MKLPRKTNNKTRKIAPGISDDGAETHVDGIDLDELAFKDETPSANEEEYSGASSSVLDDGIPQRQSCFNKLGKWICGSSTSSIISPRTTVPQTRKLKPYQAEEEKDSSFTNMQINPVEQGGRKRRTKGTKRRTKRTKRTKGTKRRTKRRTKRSKKSRKCKSVKE